MRAIFWVVVMLGESAGAQTTTLRPLDAFFDQTRWSSDSTTCRSGKPFTVAGTQGAMPGQQEGTFEAWVLPVKLLSHFAIRADVEGYSVPIDLNADAAEIEVFPDHTCDYVLAYCVYVEADHVRSR